RRDLCLAQFRALATEKPVEAEPHVLQRQQMRYVRHGWIRVKPADHRAVGNRGLAHEFRDGPEVITNEVPQAVADLPRLGLRKALPTSPLLGFARGHDLRFSFRRHLRLSEAKRSRRVVRPPIKRALWPIRSRLKPGAPDEESAYPTRPDCPAICAGATDAGLTPTGNIWIRRWQHVER